MNVPLEECLLTAGGEHPVHRLPGERQPQAEQMALHQLAPQTDRDLAEVDLGFGAGQVRLLDEHLRRATAGLDPNLRLPLGDVGAHDLVGHVVHRVLVDQPAIDPDHRVTLLPRRIQISQQHLVDHRLERIQLGTARRVRFPRLRPRRTQRLLNSPPAHPVLALQRPARHALASVTPQRGIQLDLRLTRRHRRCSFTEHIYLATATPRVTLLLTNNFPAHQPVTSTQTDN
ncbi:MULTISPECIES: hypothetical protein [Streptomyces]|uniref:Uncharacterized protein n=2 Tax=Streptomyces TaxID=1883 RepID=A0ABV9J9N4_9ACTN